jgi:hypothetical protein
MLVGIDVVFMDVDDIEPGTDFREELRKQLESCEAMLALIGKGWLGATDALGNRRLDDPSDYVRREIADALAQGVRVIPVLLQGTSIPPQEQLPEEIKDLAFRNAFELSHNRWESDVREMLARLHLLKPQAMPPMGHPSTRSRGLYLSGGIGAVVAIILAGYWTFSGRPSEPQGQPMGPLEYKTNLQGNDFSPVPILLASPDECSTKCSENPACVAMTFVPRPDNLGAGDCWLKRQVGVPTSHPTMVSAVKVRVQ